MKTTLTQIAKFIIFISPNLATEELFHPPILLTQKDKPARSEAPGYAAPCLADVDNDGKEELLVGQAAGGNIAIYEINDLTAKINQLGPKRWLKADGKKAVVPNVEGHTLSATPKLVDLDQDGIEDIISGSGSNSKGLGYIYFFKGLGKGAYGKAEILKNQEGLPILAVKDPRLADHIDQHCTHPFPVDWDNDGDLDLIIGNISGHFTIIFNEKDPNQPGYSFASTGSLLKNSDNDVLRIETPEKPFGGCFVAPFVIDWDNDGDLDLLASSSHCILAIAINSGLRETPNFEPFKTLIHSSDTKKLSLKLEGTSKNALYFEFAPN